MASHFKEIPKDGVVTSCGVQMSSEGKTCGFCEDSESKYVCPRCGVPYCSVNCYRSSRHINCSEQFYRESAKAELQDKNVDSRQMKEILKRLKNADEDEELDSDDDENIDLATRMENIDLNDANAVWCKLTESERVKFQQMVNNDDVSKLLPVWEPWWIHNEQKGPIQEIIKNEFDFKNIPEVVQNISSFSSICKVKPHPCVKWNLVNVLVAYAFCARYYNNEHFSFPLECTSMIWCVSKNLSSNQVFQSFNLAVESVIFELTNGWFSTAEENLAAVKSDVCQILAGPSLNKRNFYVLAALSDARRLFEKILAGKSKSSVGQFSKIFNDHRNTIHATVDKKKIMLMMRKFDFYLSWSNEFYSEAFRSDFI